MSTHFLVLAVLGPVAALSALAWSSRALRRARQASREREERLAFVLEALPHGVLLIDRDGTISAANAAAHRTFGASPPEMIGSRCDDPRWLLRDQDGDPRTAVQDPLSRTLRLGQPLTGVACTLAAGAGPARDVTLHAIPSLDDGGKVASIVASVEDVTSRKETEEALRRATRRDALTGLDNRASFEEQLRRLAAERAPFALVVCDVDGLKLVNDTLGHATGDEVLRLSARVLQACAPEAAAVARVGGDEFAALLPGDLGAAEAVCRKLRAALEQHDERRATPYRLILSIGATVSSGAHPDPAELFKRAEDDMHHDRLRSRRGRGAGAVRAGAEAHLSALDSRRRFGP